MGKFYVQSGNLKRVVNSASADRAAIWAVHQAMQQIAPQFRSDEERVGMPEPLETLVLDDTIQISEIGFAGQDTMEVQTFEAFRKWYALCETIGI